MIRYFCLMVAILVWVSVVYSDDVTDKIASRSLQVTSAIVTVRALKKQKEAMVDMLQKQIRYLEGKEQELLGVLDGLEEGVMYWNDIDTSVTVISAPQ